ncbi:MAG: hypothetical protein Tsb0015_12980 [Simkaniaceae bacterium]
MYRLSLKELQDDKNCLIFFPHQSPETFYIVDFLRYITFSKSAANLHVEKEVFKEVPVILVSFPKEYGETCERVAKLFHLKVSHISQCGFYESGIIIPNSEKILVVRGSYSEKEHEDLQQRLKVAGRIFDNLGID